MQRVFEGRTKQELVAEHMSRHRYANVGRAAAIEEAIKTATNGPRVSDMREFGEQLPAPSQKPPSLPE